MLYMTRVAEHEAISLEEIWELEEENGSSLGDGDNMTHRLEDKETEGKKIYGTVCKGSFREFTSSVYYPISSHGDLV